MDQADFCFPALLVGDEEFSWNSLREALRARGVDGQLIARSLFEVAHHLRGGVSLVFVGLTFPDGILRVVDLAFRACPSPPVIAVGDSLSPEVMFQLGRGGVGGVLPSQVDGPALAACLKEVKNQPFHSMSATARALVGRIGLREAQHELRHIMVRHSLALCEGSRRAAAHILGVSRPAVQRVLREGPCEWMDENPIADDPPSSAT